ncbi:hypothetical protein KUTeg_002336 [Tegillarca granosa]|uniref:Uncharacterized protein n=1 Tax=Tegillarca granosa TaxID=220873 RepID=A0ABQ9FU08_TEGGR|nr:hypothetical protein KUTeg_002336 [Tegillarca granosa]
MGLPCFNFVQYNCILLHLVIVFEKIIEDIEVKLKIQHCEFYYIKMYLNCFIAIVIVLLQFTEV